MGLQKTQPARAVAQQQSGEGFLNSPPAPQFPGSPDPRLSVHGEPVGQSWFEPTSISISCLLCGVDRHIISDEYVREHLCKSFGLKNDDHGALDEFIGVKPDIIKLDSLHGIRPETLAMARFTRALEREEASRSAGPPTADTRVAAECVFYMIPLLPRVSVTDALNRVHNKIARAYNQVSPSGSIMPIHDFRNIPVTGFPAAVGGLSGLGHGDSPRSVLRGSCTDMAQKLI